MRRADVLTVSGMKAAALVAFGAHMATIGYLIAVGLSMLFVGVVLPAVWSSQPDRRRAARAVLRLILQDRRAPR